MKRRKKDVQCKAKYPQKYITWGPKTTFHLKSNVSPVKICNKILGQLKL